MPATSHVGHFGERLEKTCGNCNNCFNPIESWDGKTAARKAYADGRLRRYVERRLPKAWSPNEIFRRFFVGLCG